MYHNVKENFISRLFQKCVIIFTLKLHFLGKILKINKFNFYLSLTFNR
jgi:hypothetical protein